jgi:hypothetical protein
MMMRILGGESDVLSVSCEGEAHLIDKKIIIREKSDFKQYFIRSIKIILPPNLHNF